MARRTVALIAMAVLLLDQGSKLLIKSLMDFGQSIELIPGVFSLTLVANKGAAFSLFSGKMAFLTLVSLIGALILLYLLAQKSSRGLLQGIALGLSAGGVTGNLIDRAFYGSVVDFFDFKIWPVFNIADSSMVIAAAIFIYHEIFRSNGNSVAVSER